jgi:diguanylate cyclase (GGDEF)-like protein
MIPQPNEGNILLVIDEQEQREFITLLLIGEGYKVKTAQNLSEATGILAKESFNLIITEFRSGEIDGLQVCKTIRQSFALRHIPIILLIRSKELMDKIKVIYAGADDYIEFPFEPGELLARIKASLWRASRDLDANPLTKLPGNASVLKELESKINSGEPFAVSYLDLNKFKEFNDYYGFERGDRVILHTGSIIINALEKFGGPSDFLGHIGGDDFIFITSPDSVETVCSEVIRQFEKDTPTFYTQEDANRGYIVVKNRAGELCRIPLLTLSIGIVSNEYKTLDHIGQIIQLSTELKNYAKTFSKNIFVKDRRRG